jgi:hypothetical protein
MMGPDQDLPAESACHCIEGCGEDRNICPGDDGRDPHCSGCGHLRQMDACFPETVETYTLIAEPMYTIEERSQAVRDAASVLRTNSGFASGQPAPLADIIVLANYILTGSIKENA